MAQEAAKLGISSAVIDMSHDEGNNLIHKHVHENVKHILRTKKVALCGIEVVCSSWSVARRAPPGSRMPKAVRQSGKFIWGLPGLNPRDNAVRRCGNIMVKNAIEYVKICLSKNIPGYIENPKTSMLWKVPWIRRQINKGVLLVNKVDFCQYGTAFKKPTIFLTWNFSVSLKTCTPNNCRCSYTGSFHETLTGISNWKFRTSAAQVYPRKLAKHFINEFLNAERTHPPRPSKT